MVVVAVSVSQCLCHNVSGVTVSGVSVPVSGVCVTVSVLGDMSLGK